MGVRGSGRPGGGCRWRAAVRVLVRGMSGGGDIVLNGGRSGGTGALGRVEDFLAGDANGLRGFDGQPDPTAADFGDGDADITSDLDGFANFSAEHQHLAPVALGELISQSGSGRNCRFAKGYALFRGRFEKKS